MSVNYAAKYAQKIDERFAQNSLTNAAINNDYDFVGVKTVNVYSIGVADMNDYSRSGSARYGNPAELDQTTQELTLAKDRSFTFTIDKGNFEDAQMVAQAGAALNRQILEKVIPEIDKHRLEKMAAKAGTVSTAAAITSSNAYSEFLEAMEALDNAKVPRAGRVCFCSAAFYKNIKLDDDFVKASDIAQNILINGQVGAVDGVPLVVVYSAIMPTKTDFIVTIPAACCAPVKLAEYKIHQDPPGVNGWLVEGRVYYDAFVLDNKAAAVYRHINASLVSGDVGYVAPAGSSGSSGSAG